MGWYGYDPGKNDHNEVAGTEFEGDFIFAMQQRFTTEGPKYPITNTTGTEEDYDHGTDAFIGGIRIDPTINFSGKNYTPYITDTKIPAFFEHTFKIGIRIGRGKRPDRPEEPPFVPFEEPVAVIGLDVDPAVYYMHQDQIEQSIYRHAPELLQQASDCLDDYLTTDPEERKELYATPLKKNPNYRETRLTAQSRYGRIHKARALLESMNTNGNSEELEL